MVHARPAICVQLPHTPYLTPALLIPPSSNCPGGATILTHDLFINDVLYPAPSLALLTLPFHPPQTAQAAPPS